MSIYDRRLLHKDEYKTEYFRYLEDGSFVIETETNVQKTLDRNKEVQANAPMRYEGEVMNQVASIDPVAAWMWCKSHGVKSYREFMTNPEHIKNFINDPDNKVWRTDRANKKI